VEQPGAGREVTVCTLVDLYKQEIVDLDIIGATPRMLSACTHYNSHVMMRTSMIHLTVSVGADAKRKVRMVKQLSIYSANLVTQSITRCRYD
jgi:hypothetical protein